MIYIKRTVVASDSQPFVLWDNVIRDAALTPSSESSDGEVENAVDDNTYDFWSPTALPATVSFDITTPVEAIGIAAHTLGSAGCTLTLQKFVASAWVSIAAQVVPDDKPILMVFPEETNVTLRIVASGGSSNPNLGVIYVGGLLRFETGILPAYTPMYMSEKVELLVSDSRSGQFINNRGRKKGYESSFNLNILDRDFVEGAEFQSFRDHYNNGGYFFFASDPAGHAEDVSYCSRTEGGEMKPSFQNDGIFYTFGMSLKGYAS
jgi:hypothetical protein